MILKYGYKNYLSQNLNEDNSIDILQKLTIKSVYDT